MGANCLFYWRAKECFASIVRCGETGIAVAIWYFLQTDTEGNSACRLQHFHFNRSARLSLTDLLLNCYPIGLKPVMSRGLISRISWGIARNFGGSRWIPKNRKRSWGIARHRGEGFLGSILLAAHSSCFAPWANTMRRVGPLVGQGCTGTSCGISHVVQPRFRVWVLQERRDTARSVVVARDRAASPPAASPPAASPPAANDSSSAAPRLLAPDAVLEHFGADGEHAG